MIPGKQLPFGRKPKKVPRRIEDDHQESLVKWFTLKYPHYADLLVALRNEAKRSVGGHMLAVRMGLKSGMPDLFLPIPVAPHHGLFIEMKSPLRLKEKSRGITPKQAHYHKRLPTMGYPTFVCFNWWDARDIIDAYLAGKLE